MSRTALALVRKFYPKVNLVVDATEPVKVEVDLMDTTAKRKDHTACALAEACKRKLRITGAIISPSRAYLVHGKTAIRYALESRASREIVIHDRGGNFAPGDYLLSVPSQATRLGAPHKRASGPGEKKRRAPRATLEVRVFR